MQALEAGNYGAAQRLFKHVCNNLEASRDVHGGHDVIPQHQLRPGSDLEAEFLRERHHAERIVPRGHGPRRIVNHVEEDPTLRGAEHQGNTGSLGKIPSKPPPCIKIIRLIGSGNHRREQQQKASNRKPSKIGLGSKGPGLQKPALKPKGAFLKGKGKERAPRAKKQTRFEANIGSESE